MRSCVRWAGPEAECGERWKVEASPWSCGILSVLSSVTPAWFQNLWASTTKVTEMVTVLKTFIVSTWTTSTWIMFWWKLFLDLKISTQKSVSGQMLTRWRPASQQAGREGAGALHRVPSLVILHQGVSAAEGRQGGVLRQIPAQGSFLSGFLGSHTLPPRVSSTSFFHFSFWFRIFHVLYHWMLSSSWILCNHFFYSFSLWMKFVWFLLRVKVESLFSCLEFTE